MYGGWYEGTVRSTSPDLAGKWGVYLMPSASADGPRAANLGGSSLAITSASENKEAAWAYLNYTLGTNEGQVTMLKEFGLVPSLLTALDDPFVSQEQPYWGGQKVWVDILSTLPKVVPSRGTPFFQDADAIMIADAAQISERRISRRQGGAGRRRQPDRGRVPACRSRNSPYENDRAGRSARPVLRRHLEQRSCGCAHRTAYAFLTPYLLVFLAFWIWPIINSFWLSFLNTRTANWTFNPRVDLGPAARRSGLRQRAEEHADHPGHPGAGHDRAGDRACRAC